MGRIVFGAVVPHPPIVLDEVGGQESKKAENTSKGLLQLARELVGSEPDTLVIISPHGPVFQDGIVILGEKTLTGNLEAFAAPQVKAEYNNDLELANRITEQAGKFGIFATVADKAEARQYGISIKLDHGTMIPLEYFRRAGFKGKLVVMGMALLLPDELYDFGMAIQRAIEDGNARVAVVASGDLSHKLNPSAPAGYNIRGQEFDNSLVEALKQGDFAGIMDLDPGLVEAAGECGYRPINILLGTFDSYEVQTRIHSYEGPFGVGYLVAEIRPIIRKGTPGLLVKNFRQARVRKLEEARGRQHPIVRLAAESLSQYLKTGRYLEQYEPLPRDLPPTAGTFVSIKKHGQLRGCIGTIKPSRKDLAKEVIYNAVSAGTEDPRFFPVELDELPQLSFSVDILGEEEEISSIEDLDPKKYGVIVRHGNRSGLLLPNLEGIDTAEEQVAIARQKAGISPREDVSLSRFEVKRYT